MGHCMFLRKGETHTAPVTYAANFADNTWAQIIEACQKNAVPDTWLVADQKSMTINGTDYAIDIIGKNHDAYSDGSGTAPLTFQMHDCYGTQYAMNSSNINYGTNGGWYASKMRNTHLPAIMALMPAEVQNGIREVTKMTSAGNQSVTIFNLPDKLFLLSEIEVSGTVNNSKSGEGNQYDYYAAGNSKVKNFSGNAYDWWTRSPASSNSAGFCGILDNGKTTPYTASIKIGVAFAFCF